MKTNPKITLLLSKLRRPLPFDYICKNILETDKFECKEKLDSLIEDGLIEEDNKFYKLKNNEN